MKKNILLFIAVFSIMSFSTIQSFAWTTPVMVSPASGSSVWAGLTVDWNAVSGSLAYQLQVDTTSAFNSPVRLNVNKAYINSNSGNSDTEQFLDNLYFGKKYYWRVRAYVTGDTSAWSATWNFTTRDYVTLSSPASGSSGWAGVTFDWLPHAGVDYYDFEADTTSAFNSPAKKIATNTYINSTDGNSDTYHYTEDMYFGKTYYWRARARNAVDTTAWSAVWTYTTRDYVTLSSPASGSSGWAGVTFDWLPHAGVDYYDFEADTTSAFNSPAKKIATNAYINSTDGNADTYHYTDDIYFGKTYYWRARARNAVDTTAWSAVWTYTTRDYVTLSSPASGSSGWAGVTFDWLPHAGVDYYDFEADTTSAFNSPAKKIATNAYINSTDGNADTYHYTDDIYFGKTYYWRARARNAVDTTAWSAVWTYTTRDYITLSSPASGSSGWAGVTFDWLPHAGVDYYDFEADTTSAFNSPAKKIATNAYINSTDGNADTYHYTEDMYFGKTYYWRARARNAVDTTAWSAVWTYTTRDYVTLSSPANGATGISVAGTTLDWLAHTGVDNYQMQMDTINIFPSPLLSVTKAYFNSSSSNTDTQNGTGALLANHIYFWRVRAINLVDTTAWTVWAFNTGATPVLIPSDPILVSPINSAIGQPTSLTLDWSASTNATSYEYQYDTSPSFSTSINGSTALSQANISGLNINNITYYWRVRALRGTTLYSNWSTVWHFTTGCSLSTPVSSPANICGSGSTLLVATGAIGYHWYDAATTGNLLGSSATYNTPVLTQTDTFYVCAYDGVCESGRIPVIVTVSPYPVPTITANGPINFCGGNSVLLTAGGGSSYHWNTGATSTSITVTQSGSYYATVSALGCSDNTDTIHVIVLPLPATPASIMGNYFVCSNSYGESYSISSVPNATSYQWTVPSGATIVSGQGSTSIVVNWGTVSGDICVSASNDSCNGIAACTPITVVLPPGNPVSVVGNISVCENATQVYSISSVTGATSYYWTIPSGANIVSGQGTTSVTVTWGSTGDNVCVVAINSCDTSANVCSMVTVNPNPSIPTITQVGNTLQSSVATGYQWYDGSTAISGANSQTYIPTASGTYSVLVTNSYGCTTMSAPFNFIYVGIDELTSIGYKIYPNPVNSILTFEQSSSGKIVYSICDATGRIVIDKNASVARKISIDVSMLSPGIYIFCVEGNINKRMLFVKE